MTRKNLSDQLGSALAHIQDLTDTIVHVVFKRASGSGRGFKSLDRALRFLSAVGDSYYRRYTEIKKKSGSND